MRVLLATLVALAIPWPLSAQSPAQSPQTITLTQAVQYATEHYPTVKAALEQVSASETGITVARGAYLPRLDSLWQSNRGTVNNIFGQVLPQSVIPSMSGPVLPSASSGSVWGSAAGALFTWEPFDLGLREATVSGAQAAVASARAAEGATRLDVQQKVADAFLTLAALGQRVTAAQADLDRRDVLARVTHALADNQLRPGAEASRADAERAAAQTRLIQAQEARTVAQAMFVRLLGAGQDVTIDAAGLLERLPPGAAPSADVATHPLVQLRQAALDQARVQEDILSKTDRPRLYLQSSVFARGTGANANGQLDGGFEGLGFDRANWVAGFQVVLPNLFDFSSLRARQAGAAASERSQAALYDEAVLSVTADQRAATAMVDATRAIAANTPIQLAAAQQTETQARARYQAGLTTIVEVADAQSLLAQSELDDTLARVDVWRALLASASAHGDLAPFLRLVQP